MRQSHAIEDVKIAEKSAFYLFQPKKYGIFFALGKRISHPHSH
jgi:hypothetical protein